MVANQITKEGEILGGKNNEFYFGKARFEVPLIYLGVNNKNYLKVEVWPLE